MRDECVSLPKTKAQLSQLHDDDEDVFATSLIDRYAARPHILENMCLAEFAVSYDVVSSTNYEDRTGHDDYSLSGNETVHTNDTKKIKLLKGLGYMTKRKHPAIMQTKRYKVTTEPERHYHAKILLYFPWRNEDQLISGYSSYNMSYISKQTIIHSNAAQFNDDCELFDLSQEDIDRNIMQTAWDLVAPTIAQEDVQTQEVGFDTVQERSEEWGNMQYRGNGQDQPMRDPLCRLYEKAAKRQHMAFSDYCMYMRSLNAEQLQIVMFNWAWCKKYISSVRNGKKIEGYRVFLSGSGGTGKSHVVRLIQRDMSYFLRTIVNADPDQPIVLVTAPTGSAAYNIGGSTIHAALSMSDRSIRKLSYEKHCMMQLKLEHMMLLVTDEVSMVGFDCFQ